MTPRTSGLGLALLSLAALALVLGVLSARVELFLASAPIVLRLLTGLRPARAPRYRLTHEISSARLFEGERLTVTWTLAADTELLQVELFEALPGSAEIRAGANRAVLSVRAGETARWSYDAVLPERARLVLGVVHARVWQPSGLAALECVHRDAKLVSVYPHAGLVPRLPVPLRTQTSIGNYVSPLVGEGLEPGEIRPFAPGDRVRHVNWRASLRLDRLFVTRYQQERNADVVLMLDTLASAGAGPTSSLHAALRAAASLAAAYLARKDRVGLIEYGGVLRWVRPGSGRRHFERLLDTLLRAEVTFTYVAKDLELVPPRVLPPQALVIALSALLDARFVQAAENLAARGFDLVVLSVDPVAATRAALPPTSLVDAACRLWRLERAIRLDGLAARGLRVLRWDAEEPLEVALARVPTRRRPRRTA